MVKRYLNETYSWQIERWLRSASPSVTSRLSEIEIASALARRWRDGALDKEGYERRLARLEQDLESHLFIIEMRPSVIAWAVRLTTKYPLRAGDAIQLASALALRDPSFDRAARFVCFDARLNAAAAAEGFELYAG